MSNGLLGVFLPIVVGLLTMTGTGMMIYLGVRALRRGKKPPGSVKQSLLDRLPTSWPAGFIFIGAVLSVADGMLRTAGV